MDKITCPHLYTESVKNNLDFLKRYYFHSILDLNLIKLDLILKYGILSKNEIEKLGLVSLYTHQRKDFDSKNGSTFISVSRVKDDISLNSYFESFTLHALSTFSLLVNKELYASSFGERESFFDDESFIKDKVEVKDIKGIFLPSHLTNEQIKNLPLIPNDLSCFSKTYINSLLDLMEQYFKTSVDREKIMSSLKKLWSLFAELERPENSVLSACQMQRERYGTDIKDELSLMMSDLFSEKYGIQNPTLIEILNKINESLDVYEIGPKLIKKL